MKNNKILIFFLALFLLQSAIAVEVEFTLDKNNRLPVFSDFLKGTIMSFEFEDKTYTVKMGDLDFKNERVTIQWISPQSLGTNIFDLDRKNEIDLDEDDEKDIRITLTNLFEDVGINENMVKGTVRLKFEVISEEPIENNVVTTTTTTTIKEDTNISAGEEITGKSILGNFSIIQYKNWVFGGLIILALVFIILIRKSILNLLKSIFKDLKKNKKEDIPKGPKEHAPCPKCGRDTVVGDKFCIGCGAKLSSKPRFCTKCGERVRMDSKFCASCGSKI